MKRWIVRGATGGAGLVFWASALAGSPRASEEPVWLRVVNRYRASAGVAPVIESTEASAGAAKHADYLVANHAVGHDEYQTQKRFSREGLRAGRTGNVFVSSGRLPTDREIVEGLLTAPFHGLAMLDPEQTAFGFGKAGDKRYNAASMPIFWDRYVEPSDTELSNDTEVDWETIVARVVQKYPNLTGRSVAIDGSPDKFVVTIDKRRFVVTPSDVRELGPTEIAAVGGASAQTPRLYMWPGPDTSVPLIRYSGNENPNPLSGCSGYGASAGLPILVFGKPIELSNVSVTDGSGGVQKICVLTARTFQSLDSGETELIRAALRTAAIIVPKAPLVPGQSYRVVADAVGGEHLDWSFAISKTDSIGLPPSHPFAAESTPGVAYQLHPELSPSQASKARLKTTTKKAGTKK